MRWSDVTAAAGVAGTAATGNPGFALAGLGGLASADEARRQREENLRYQREFAQMGIRWRAEDARAAGLHPLSVLGAGGASYSSAPIVTPLGDALGTMGQNVSRAAGAGSSRTDLMLTNARMVEAMASAKRDEAQAAYYTNLAAKTAQEMRQAKPLPDQVVVKSFPLGDRDAGIVESPLSVDAIKVVPSEQRSASSMFPSRESSVSPFYQEHRWADGGGTVLMPREEIGDMLDSMPWPMSWALWGKILWDNMGHWNAGLSRQRPGGDRRHSGGGW